MGLKSFFQSIKGVFWFNSGTDELIDRESASAEEHDVFFLARDVDDCEEEIKELRSWTHSFYEDPRIKLNDPDSMEPYIDVSLEVKTGEGDFHLIYYENDELVLRGDRGAVMEVREPISEELNLEFKRV